LFASPDAVENETVTATGRLTTAVRAVGARVIIVYVSVVAVLKGGVDRSIAASRNRLAVGGTNSIVHVIAVVADLAGLHETVAATGILAGRGAKTVVVIGDSQVAFLADGGLHEAVAAGGNFTSGGAKIAVIQVAVVAFFGARPLIPKKAVSAFGFLAGGSEAARAVVLVAAVSVVALLAEVHEAIAAWRLFS
jgi:hypothetical protein